ncbi:unnamed protein product, partial [marine sediment metagenome]
EWGAAEHTAIGDNAPHHTRYTNAEAVAAAKTVKLDDFATPDDNADLNASTTRHGLFKKLDNSINHFLNGKGNWVEVDIPAGGIWTLAETLSPTGVATITSSTFATHDLWMLFIELISDEADWIELRLRLNGVSGNNYTYRTITGTVIAVVNAQTSYHLGRGVNAFKVFGQLLFEGKRGVAASLNMKGGLASLVSLLEMMDGNFNGNVDITSFTVYPSAGNITGKIAIYYYDY